MFGLVIGRSDNYAIAIAAPSGFEHFLPDGGAESELLCPLTNKSAYDGKLTESVSA